MWSSTERQCRSKGFRRTVVQGLKSPWFGEARFIARKRRRGSSIPIAGTLADE